MAIYGNGQQFLSPAHEEHHKNLQIMVKLRAEAQAAYETWIRECPGVGAAFSGDDDVHEGFIDGYMFRATGMVP